MRTLTIYEASDGSRHETEVSCLKYEAVIKEVADVMSKLRPRPSDDGCAFSNGHGYLQHPKDAFLGAQRELLRIARRSFRADEFREHFEHALQADAPVGLRFVSRAISECCPAPVDGAWRRLCCVDQQFREWGQPYYALNPDKGERVPL